MVALDAGWLLPWWLLGSLLLLTLDAVLAPSPRKITIERQLPAKVRLGEPTISSVFLTNLLPRAMTLLVRDAWEPTANARPRNQRLALPARERRKLDFQLIPERRGIRRSASVTVRSFGPLRLAARQATLTSPAELKVLPPFHSRKHLPSRIARLREIDGKTSVMIRGQGTEFDSLREYVRGDDVRSLDWRATARRQELTVRTWRPERDRRVVIVLDTGRTAAVRIQNETRLDTAFESALLLSALTASAGDRTNVIAYDRRLRARVAGLTGAEQQSRLIDTLATVEPDLIETDWTAIPAEVTKLSSGKSLVVLLTSLDSIGAARGLLSVLPQLTSKHTVVVATVVDDELHKLSSQRRTRDETYLAAAAERSLLESRQLTAAVKRLGAEVVAAPALDLPPRLADHYLALKAAGRL